MKERRNISLIQTFVSDQDLCESLVRVFGLLNEHDYPIIVSRRVRWYTVRYYARLELYLM
jgi:hypothetical protein